MDNLVQAYNSFLNEVNKDNLTDTAKFNLKADTLKDKIKNNFDKANQSQAKAQDLLQKGDADKASIETLKYRKALAATSLAQIDYKLFIKTEALKKQKEKESKK
jgi:hypothetical protein